MAANVMQSEDNDFRRRGEGGDNQQRQMNSQDIKKKKDSVFMQMSLVMKNEGRGILERGEMEADLFLNSTISEFSMGCK